MKKITIIGPGAMGIHVAAAFAENKEVQLSLIGTDPKKLAALRTHGVMLELPRNQAGEEQRFLVPFANEAYIGPLEHWTQEQHGVQDFVFLCLRADALTGVLLNTVHATLGNEATCYVIGTNGLPVWLPRTRDAHREFRFEGLDPDGGIHKFLDKVQTIGMVYSDIANALIPTRPTDPVWCRLTRTTSTIALGEISDTTGTQHSTRCIELQQLLRPSTDTAAPSLKFDISLDIAQEVFGKLLVNTINPFCAILQQNIGTVIATPGMKDLLQDSMRELYHVASCFLGTAWMGKTLTTFQEETVQTIIARWSGVSRDHVPSMARDNHEWRPSERRALLRSVRELAQYLEMPTLPCFTELHNAQHHMDGIILDTLQKQHTLSQHFTQYAISRNATKLRQLYNSQEKVIPDSQISNSQNSQNSNPSQKCLDSHAIEQLEDMLHDSQTDDPFLSQGPHTPNTPRKSAAESGCASVSPSPRPKRPRVDASPTKPGNGAEDPAPLSKVTPIV